MVTYKDAPRDGRGDGEPFGELVALLRGASTPRVLRPQGSGRAGWFQLDYGEAILRRDYKDPVLVAVTEGVGHKQEVGYRIGATSRLGVDVVAQCVNDIVAQGAEPLFFLDHVTTGKLPPPRLGALIRGISTGCREAGCALLGGATRARSGFHPVERIDVSGFAVGVADAARLVRGDAVRPGDQIVGLRSSGLHCGGFEHVCDLLSRRQVRTGSSRGAPWDLRGTPVGLDGALGDVLLTPSAIYVKPLLQVLRVYRRKRVIHAMSHIKGGLRSGVQRLLPAELAAGLWRDSWRAPPIFSYLEKALGLRRAQMFESFNMGLGMVLVVSRHFCDALVKRLNVLGVEATRVGEIEVRKTSRTRQVQFRRSASRPRGVKGTRSKGPAAR